MGTYEDRAKLIWSLSGSGLSTTISANGNSGTWGDTATDPFPSSPVKLSPATDFQLMVSWSGKTSTPTVVIGLGYFDSQGNLFAPTTLQIPSTSFTGTPPLTAALNAGVRAGSGGTTYFAFPAYGQVYWTCSGGTLTGVELNLWGR